MTTPGGVPNLPLGALTLDTLASKTQDMTTPAMKARAVERFPTIFNNSTGLNPALDITPFGILTGIWSGFNSQIANADPADVNGPEDLPGLLLQFIEGIPVVGQFVDLLEAILGTYTGDDTTLLTVQAIFAPIRAIVDALTAVSGGTGGLGNFFPDLLGLLGNPTGLGSGGTVGLGSLSSIPLFGPLFSIFGGATTSTQAGNFFTSITGLFGNPAGLLTGSPTVPALGSIPILGPVFGLFNGASNATQAGNFVTSIMSLFGNPTGTLTGSPTVPALGSIPILGPVLGLFGGATNATQANNFFTNLLSFLGTPTLTGSTGSFNPTTAATTFINDILNPTGLLALLSGGLLSGSVIPGLPASKITSGIFPFTQVSGLNGATNIGVTVQDFIDTGVQALLGGTDTGWFLDDWKTALTQIPVNNVIGAGGMADVGQTFYTMWDSLTSAFRLDAFTGTILSDVSSAAQDTSFTALNAGTLAGSHQVTLNVRTNNPIDGALERTTVSNFNWTLLGTGTTPTNFAVTSAASAIGITRMPSADTKGKAYWYSWYTGTITGFYINFGRLNLDGSVDHLFQTPDLSSTLTTTGSWDSYTLPDANKIVHNHSQNIVTEFIVVGSGTVNIAGQDYQWNTGNFPGATTKRSGASRNTAGGTPTLAMTTSTMTSAFSTKTPWVGLGRVDVDPDYHPPEPWNTTVAGAFTYTIPTWARVAGTLIDYLAVGGGGGGQSGGYFAVLEGGRCGAWNTGTLVYGTDIPLGTTALTGTVGDNAAGGVNPFILQPGDNGNATTITGLTGGFSTKTAAGGLGGGQSGNSWNQAGGEGAGNQIVGGYQAFGGAAAGVNQDGNTPGGGGGSGYPAVGRAGGEGRVWFRARQP